MQTVRVKVDIVPLNWMRGSIDEICNLIPIVHRLLVDDKMFVTPFVKETLLELVVMLNREVFNWFFLPFLVQLLFSMIYFGMFALSEKQDWKFALVVITFLVVLMNTFFLWVEYLQISTMRPMRKYFYSSTNLIDFSGICANYIIVTNEVFGRGIFSNNLKTYLIVIAVFCLWFRAFYWMRVFERTALLILLIKRTLTGILSFMVLLFIILLMFTNMLYVLNLAQHPD